jgi:hypothetical protein
MKAIYVGDITSYEMLKKVVHIVTTILFRVKVTAYVK